jgi:ABC-type transporter Mla subunit MlaD
MNKKDIDAVELALMAATQALNGFGTEDEELLATLAKALDIIKAQRTAKKGWRQ